MKLGCAWCGDPHDISECPEAARLTLPVGDGEPDTAHVPAPLHEGLLNAGRREGWLKCWMDIAPTGLSEAEVCDRETVGKVMAMLAYPVYIDEQPFTPRI